VEEVYEIPFDCVPDGLAFIGPATLAGAHTWRQGGRAASGRQSEIFAPPPNYFQLNGHTHFAVYPATFFGSPSGPKKLLILAPKLLIRLARAPLGQWASFPPVLLQPPQSHLHPLQKWSGRRKNGRRKVKSRLLGSRDLPAGR